MKLITIDDCRHLQGVQKSSIMTTRAVAKLALADFKWVKRPALLNQDEPM